MEASTVIDNLDVDRLRKEDAAKEEEKRQGKLLGLQRVAGGRGGCRIGRRGGAVTGSKEAVEKASSRI